MERINHLKENGFNPKSILFIEYEFERNGMMFKKIFEKAKIRVIDPDEYILSDKEKEVTYYTSERRGEKRGSYYKEQSFQFIEEEGKKEIATTLDKVVSTSDDDIKSFDLIKINVHGAELDVMKGGKNIIQSAMCIILNVKALEYNEGAPSFDEVISYMSSIGYTLYDIVKLNYLESGHFLGIDAVFIKRNSPLLLRGIIA